MNDETREQRWRRLIAEEEDAFERARCNSENAGPDGRANYAKDWFAASSRLLKEHVRSHLVLHEGGPLEPYPWQAISHAAKLMEAFASGNLPDPVKWVTGAGGRPDRWPGERQDIAIALHYIEMAKRRDVRDRRFIATVTETFQVDRTTVHSWVKDHKVICEGTYAPPADSFPEALRKAGARYHFNRTGERMEGVE